MEQALQHFQDRIRYAGTTGSALRFRGGGSKDWYGQRLQGDVLDTSAYSGIVDYDPTELVVTVRAGTPLAELQATLAQHNQFLAFEPPHFGASSTVGGMVAAGLSGPRRFAVGSVRDFVLGVSIMDAQGELLNFGGRVMKNVAGYDLSRLMAGSMGSLALILEVSLKVLPRPFEEATLRLELSQAEALQRMNQWGGQPLPVSGTLWHDGQLYLRLSGAKAAVQAARAVIGGEEIAGGGPWDALREQQHPFFAQAPCWRLSLPSLSAPLDLPGPTLIEWGGALRWLSGEYDAQRVRSLAAQAGGHATLFRGGDKASGVFQPLPAPLLALHRRLKEKFDPRGIFNPGRLYPEF
jgi:glycolate oxidase FAD binding subunit